MQPLTEIQKPSPTYVTSFTSANYKVNTFLYVSSFRSKQYICQIAVRRFMIKKTAFL